MRKTPSTWRAINLLGDFVLMKIVFTTISSHFDRCSSGTGLSSCRSLGPRSRTKSIHFGADIRSFCLPGMSGGGAPSGGSIGSSQVIEASSILLEEQPACGTEGQNERTLRITTLLTCTTRPRRTNRQAHVAPVSRFKMRRA